MHSNLITRRKRMLRLGVAVCATIAALGVCAGTAAFAATPSSVVPAGGKVAGEGYSYWLGRAWQTFFAARPPAPKPCLTVDVNGQRTALIDGGYAGGKQAYTCTVPAGRPLYVIGLSVECSTLEKPPFHGRTAAQLEHCARTHFKGATTSASLDGQVLGNYQSLTTATGPYAIRLPKKNVLGSTKRTGRSAAYGEGLLLTGLTAGTHHIKVNGRIPKVFHIAVTYTVHVS